MINLKTSLLEDMKKMGHPCWAKNDFNYSLVRDVEIGGVLPVSDKI